MDAASHRAWLDALAAEDRARRAVAEPELERREVRLRAERRKLELTRAEEVRLEAALDTARPEANEPAGG